MPHSRSHFQRALFTTTARVGSSNLRRYPRNDYSSRRRRLPSTRSPPHDRRNLDAGTERRTQQGTSHRGGYAWTSDRYVDEEEVRVGGLQVSTSSSLFFGREEGRGRVVERKREIDIFLFIEKSTGGWEWQRETASDVTTSEGGRRRVGFRSLG